MSFQHEMQSSRYELKYVIEEERAVAVRDYCRGYLIPDEFADPAKNNSYTIHSLYCDSRDLQLYQSTLEGRKNRFKLRMRFYDDTPGHPCFLEIKRRLADVICKERAAVCKDRILPLLEGRWPDKCSLLDRRPKAVMAFENYCRTMIQMRAQGCVYVSYNREAYVSPASDQIRVTFDRNIEGTQDVPGSRLAPPTGGVSAGIRGVVLELKFTDRFPNWMRNLVLTFNLCRGSMAKYVHCIQAIGVQSVWDVSSLMKAAS